MDRSGVQRVPRHVGVEQPLPGTGEKRWIVLLVDDEPEVHEITRLILAKSDNREYAGLPIELHSAHSAAEAKLFLRQHPDTAVILLDVVMESDDAGLALVRYIREEIDNADVQIVLRTGQPGMAPERDVVAQYEINGYFLKTEITAQKLYSILISSLRTYSYIRALRKGTRPDWAEQLTDSRTHKNQSLVREIIGALETDSGHLLVQPQLHLASEDLAGMEVTVAFRAGGGVFDPMQLAGIVREPEARIRIDRWLLRQTCTWARSWYSMNAGMFRTSVPLLTADVWNCEFLETVDQCLVEFPLPPGTLDLEVPENILLADLSNASDALAFLQSKGISITLAGFGSGMISLPQLRRLRPDRVKVNRAFVRNVTNEKERTAIARSIIALAHTLGMTVIADGIESERDFQFFKWEGCDVGQGEFLARSIPIVDVAEYLASKRRTTH